MSGLENINLEQSDQNSQVGRDNLEETFHAIFL
jgi:hypothetical protein